MAERCNALGSAAARDGPQGTVLYWPGEDGYARGHERATHLDLARRLAALKGFAAGGIHEPGRRCAGPIYVLARQTLVVADKTDATLMTALGIRDEHDLFGGVVPHPVAATKAITHPLAGPDSPAPPGWSADMGRRVRDVVLAGFSVFSRDDARRAFRLLLEHGPVRVKRVRESGGRGQTVLSDPGALDAVLGTLDPAELAHGGLVLEEELHAVTTCSVGQVRVADLVATYHGLQRLTPDNTGSLVYGGSDLTVVRGGFDALLALDLAPEQRLAVCQARLYDAAATDCFPGFFASRRNYDVVQGLDHRGRRRSGVLEQSWRVGGASGAEIAALEAFRADPALRTVHARCVEIYGDAGPPPPNATVAFRGEDERVGFIAKYVTVEPHDNAR